MAVYFDPRVGGGSGNLVSAIGLYDQYFGTGSKIRQAQLDDATNAVQLHANELAKSNVDRSTFEGGLTAFGQAPAGLRKPTTEMSPEEYQQWQDIHAKNGVKDFDGAASAWNKTMLSNFGKLTTPQGGMATEFQTGPNGITAGGIVLPKELQQPQTPQPAAPPAQAAPGAPAPAPTGASKIPDLTPSQMFSPALRQVHQYQLETAGKEQELAKASREAALGTPEEQNRARDFSSSAADLSKNLEGLKAQVVSGTGGNAPWHAEGFGKVSILPKQIAENWKHVNNPGGASLKPGQGDEAAGELIPLPSMKWYNLGGKLSPITNEKTSQAINLNEELLAAKIKAYENDPATRLPVLGLDPQVRSLVGLPPQRLIDNLQAQGKDASQLQSGTAPQTLRTIQPGEENTVRPGETVIWGPTGAKFRR